MLFVWFAGAAVLLMSVSLNTRIRNLLSAKIGVFLGWISFPLYLVHVPILCSAGCATFLWALPRVPAPYPNVIAALATIVGSILAAIPLAVFNDRLLFLLNLWVKVFRVERSSETRQQ